MLQNSPFPAANGSAMQLAVTKIVLNKRLLDTYLTRVAQVSLAPSVASIKIAVMTAMGTAVRTAWAVIRQVKFSRTVSM